MTADLEQLPAVDLSIWNEQIRQDFFPLWLSAKQETPFQAHAIVKSRPGCRIAHVRASAHAATLARSDCAAQDERFLKIFWLLDGEARLEQQQSHKVISAGHWVVCDAHRPYRMDLSHGATFVVLFCEEHDAEFRSLLASTDSQAFATENASQLALESVLSASGVGMALDRASCSVLMYSVRRYLEIAVQARTDMGAPGARGTALHALVDLAKDFVFRHQSDPTLCPERIARALQVSRRTLYNAFASIGESPQAYVQGLRLQRGRELLRDPGRRYRSVTELAMELGFSDAAYFSRAFRREFGESPSSTRSHRI
jgi:AraC family transcriptional regulator, positive regulator of tynA and feaB